MHVETLGEGPRMVLVHGSVAPGWMTWSAQKPLASRFTLVVPIRSGYPPNPRRERIDFEVQARELRDLLEPGITSSDTPTAASSRYSRRPTHRSRR